MLGIKNKEEILTGKNVDVLYEEYKKRYGEPSVKKYSLILFIYNKMQSFIDNLDETAMKAAADFAKQATQKFTETTEFKDALAYVETMVSKGGKPVPADENSLDALVEMKYAL